MTTPQQIARRNRIEAAAYAELRQSGYKSTTLIAVARRACASNETLYKWYGNKQGLFQSLVEANAREARELLEGALKGMDNPIETLKVLGPILLSLVTSDKAVVLNRAAVGDLGDTGTLATAIAEFGRDTIFPLLCDLVEAARKAGLIDCRSPSEAADIYIRLLIGDLQLRRVLGVLDEHPPPEIERRSGKAMELFLTLYAPAK